MQHPDHHTSELAVSNIILWNRGRLFRRDHKGRREPDNNSGGELWLLIKLCSNGELLPIPTQIMLGFVSGRIVMLFFFWPVSV